MILGLATAEEEAQVMAQRIEAIEAALAAAQAEAAAEAQAVAALDNSTDTC